MSRTKKLKTRLVILNVLRFVCTAGPMIYYTILGLVRGEIEVKDKICLTLTIIAAVALYLAGVAIKNSLRCPLYILLIGIYVCLDSIMPLILLLGLGTILDELLLTPLTKRASLSLKIRQEMEIDG